MAISEIKKRDGRIVEFEEKKITDAIHKALVAVKSKDGKTARKLSNIVVKTLNKKYKERIPSVEDIQNIVVQTLRKKGYKKVAKEYTAYRLKKIKLRELKKIFRIEKEPKLTVNALEVLRKRYLLKNDKGKIIETPANMFVRVAKSIAEVDRKYGGNVRETAEEFYKIMSRLEFLPNSPTLFNAGTKTNFGLSACYVLPVKDSLKSIFETIKNMVIIEQSGGGCIIEGSKVFTSYCGLENIDVLYKRVLNENNKNEIINNLGSFYINVSDLDIKTFSYNKRKNIFEKDRILKVWKFDKINDTYKIITDTKTKIITSSWHPFLVYDGFKIIKKKADELKKDDILIRPDVSSSWIFKDYIKIKGIKIDEDIGWLVGFFMGNGSLDKWMEKLRFRLCDGRMDTIRKAQKILNKKFGIKIKIQKEKGKRNEILYCLCTTNQRFVKLFLNLNNNLVGRKCYKISIPEYMLKSPVNVIRAFIAGLIDSDGYSEIRNGRTSFSTSSKEMSEQLLAILSLLGLDSRKRVRKPRKPNEKTMYEITLATTEKLIKLKQLILPFMTNYFRKKTLKATYYKELGVMKRLQIPFLAIDNVLQSIGINTHKTRIWHKKIKVGNKKFYLGRWRRNKGINKKRLLLLIDSLLKIVKNKKHIHHLKLMEMIISNCTVVENIEKYYTEKSFYDFTTEKNSNYLAGIDGMALIHNTGFDFSELRPKGDLVKSTKGIASGPCSFMRVFDVATDVIKQGGRRRGALMGILRVEHPDILEFITIKSKENILTNFNLSVAITDKFIKAVKKNKKYDLTNPRNGEVVKKLKARKVWNLIIENAWKSGDPGLIFIDEINRKNPIPELKIKATNPCGEQPLLQYESCNLGSINLSKMVKNGKIDWDKLKKTIHTAVHFLDNVIDANIFPLKEIEEMTKANRKIGLGVMGWAELLIRLEIPYDSQEAINLAEKVMKFITEEARKKSEELGLKRGSFPNFEKSVWKGKYNAMRNATVTTIAPTGSISIIAGCSSGIEPLFAVSFMRNVLEGSRLFEVNPFFERIAKKRGFYSGKLLEKIAKTGSIQNIKEIPKDVKGIFKTALDIKPEWHVKIQSAFQKYVDNAVSKTINLPNKATKNDVKKAFELAYKLKCKGITVYRYGCKPQQVLYLGKLNVIAESEYSGGCPTFICPF